MQTTKKKFSPISPYSAKEALRIGKMSESIGESSTATEINPEDCLKVLLATDIHLGYLEENAIRGEIDRD